VDFTSIRNAAEAEACTTLGFLDEMYFLLALVSCDRRAERPEGRSLHTPTEDAVHPTSVGDAFKGVPRIETLTVKERLALKTLVMPGGLGSTMKVMILGKGEGTPKLTALSFHVRVT